MSTFDQQFIFQAFNKIIGGRVILSLPDGSEHHFGEDLQGSDNLPIRIQVNDKQAFQWVISRGDIGVAESYFKNLWQMRITMWKQESCYIILRALKNYNIIDNK
jgi:hypothetical protein